MHYLPELPTLPGRAPGACPSEGRPRAFLARKASRMRSVHRTRRGRTSSGRDYQTYYTRVQSRFVRSARCTDLAEAWTKMRSGHPACWSVGRITTVASLQTRNYVHLDRPLPAHRASPARRRRGRRALPTGWARPGAPLEHARLARSRFFLLLTNS